MTKDILIKIQGMQFLEEQPNQRQDREEAPIEVITAGSYYHRNGKHYIKYEEASEARGEATSSLIKVQKDSIEVMKKGMTNMHMVFQENKKNVSYYNTPFGNLLVGIETSSVDVQEEEDKLRVKVDYSLEVNYEHLADCSLSLDVCSKGIKEARLLS